MDEIDVAFSGIAVWATTVSIGVFYGISVALLYLTTMTASQILLYFWGTILIVLYIITISISHYIDKKFL